MIAKGILFGDVHSYYDLNLILSGSEIPPAKPKTNYVDIPGGDGSVDLTEANGEVKYYDRDCKFTFTMHPSGDLSEAGWEEKKTEVSNAINGKRCKITLDKDSDFYYVGRCYVDNYVSNKRIRQIVVRATVEPYKYKQNETVITVEFPEEFNHIESTFELEIYNSRKSVCPVFECTGDECWIIFNNDTYSFDGGTFKSLDIQFKQGINHITVAGTGTLTIRFQEGEL